MVTHGLEPPPADMGGHFLSNRPIRVSLATAKKNSNGGGLNAAALAQQVR